MNDNVNRPKHYTAHPSGIECIQITRHMGFNLGNVLKYIWRCDLKGGVEDLRKAIWYLNDEINKLEGRTEKVELPPNCIAGEDLTPEDEDMVEINGFKIPRREINIAYPEETQEMARTPKPLPIDEDAPAEFATPIIPKHLLEEANRGLDKSKSVPSTETKQPRNVERVAPARRGKGVQHTPKPKGNGGSIRASRKSKSRD